MIYLYLRTGVYYFPQCSNWDRKKGPFLPLFKFLKYSVVVHAYVEQVPAELITTAPLCMYVIHILSFLNPLSLSVTGLTA